MKNSLLSVFMLGVLACGSTDDSAPVVGPKRTLVTGALVVGSAVNLVPDPGFALTQQPGSYGGFYGSTGADSAELVIVPVRDSRSPAGLRGSVALVTAAGATDEAGAGITLLATVTGGAGPFHAEVWISKSMLSGTPAAFDASDFNAAIFDQRGGAMSMTAVVADARVVDGRTWIPTRVDFAGGLTDGGYFSVGIPTSGGTWHVAAPSLVAQPLVDGLPPRALRWDTALRAQTAVEKNAVAKLRARRPR